MFRAVTLAHDLLAERELHYTTMNTSNEEDPEKMTGAIIQFMIGLFMTYQFYYCSERFSTVKFCLTSVCSCTVLHQYELVYKLLESLDFRVQILFPVVDEFALWLGSFLRVHFVRDSRCEELGAELSGVAFDEGAHDSAEKLVKALESFASQSAHPPVSDDEYERR